MQDRVRALEKQGVLMPAPELVFVAPEVPPEAIEPGAQLLPFTRVEGASTLVRRGAKLGTGGPVLARNCAVGEGVELGSGTFESAVFLRGSSFGPSGHARGGTLFDEGANAAHAVGTKQTILLPFAVLGSNINFCDVLLAGGTGPKNHSEVGSGFIHFNFTPFGPSGDKATPSLFGDVPRGVWLRERRVFLGGAGGVVGPVRVGFGTALGAGSVFRRDRDPGVLVLGERLAERELPFDPTVQRRAQPRLTKNLEFIAQLVALHAFFQELRVPLAAGDPFEERLLARVPGLLREAIDERLKQLDRYIEGMAGSAAALARTFGDDHQEVAYQRSLAPRFAAARPHLQDVSRGAAFGHRQARQQVLAAVRAGQSYATWARSLSEEEVEAGRLWLGSIVAGWLGDPSGAGGLVPARGG